MITETPQKTTMTDKEIEQKLTLLAAGDPKTDAAQLILRAATVINRLRSEVNYERARADFNDNTLTDAEREAVAWFSHGPSTMFSLGWEARAATLRGLLERMK